MSKRLEMLFRNEAGGNVTIGIDNPAEPADPAEVAAAMDIIINENTFITPNGEIVAKRGARIVERTVDTIDIDN